MSNILATSNIVAKTSLAILKNRLGFAKSVNRDYEDEYTENKSRGYSPGQTINIKKPPQYLYRTGRIAAPQATAENTVPLTLAQGGCDIVWTALERTLSLQEMEKKVRAAMLPVINQIDFAGCELARRTVGNSVGTVGTLPTTQAAAMQLLTSAGQKLSEALAPDDDRTLVLNPAMNAALIQGMSGLFNSSQSVSEQYKRGVMVPALGFEIMRDQNIATHINGAATPTNVNGAGQVGSNITVAAVAGGTLTLGSTITLPGVFAVNRVNKTSIGQLQQFVVTADVLAGATSIPISPAIVTTGAFQNVTGSPTTAQPYVITGGPSLSYATNIAFHRDAFTLAMVPMYAPKSSGAIDVSQKTDDGMTVKVTTYYDPTNDVSNVRLDVLWGYAATYPELAVKVIA